MTGPAAIMLQGTGSDVGKSVLVAGLCRVARRRGLTVWPFKPQNMSNNAAVAVDGGEIGRAHWLQALAAGVAPSVHMNPVLLKPETDRGSQVIVHGRVAGRKDARDWQAAKPSLLKPVLDSFAVARRQADLVVVEGAGSPAEVNLRAGDIANMGFASATRTPVVLIGDIDRGGVIASIVGTHALLPADDRAHIHGFIINKFRGDPALFDDGLAIIAERTGWPSLGVVPWLAPARRLPAEDAVVLEAASAPGAGTVKVAMPLFSRIANFDDLDPLKAEADVTVQVVPPGQPLPRDADLILLPGTKATLAEAAFVAQQGWDVDIHAHVRAGGAVLGLCGGYQLLGGTIRDPAGAEGITGERPGLGLLDVDTTIDGAKTVQQTQGTSADGAATFEGYEIHMGDTDGPDCARPFLTIGGQPHGACSPDGLVQGGYVHGLFASDAFRRHYLARRGAANRQAVAYRAGVDAALDEIATALEQALDMDAVLRIAGL